MPKAERVKPVNLKHDEAEALLSAKEGFGYPPGSDPWVAMERARAKVAAALNGKRPLTDTGRDE